MREHRRGTAGMRPPAGAERVRDLMRRLGNAARGEGRIYLVGGSSAVLVGWRECTVDIDLKLDPEPPGVFAAIARAKDALDVNIELAAPDDFIPAIPGWRERSRFIVRHGPVDYYHYDFHAQALAKIERGHELDLLDVGEMARRRLIRPERLAELFDAIQPALERYPAIDPPSFREKVSRAIMEIRS